jgi:PAS domain S-box-containing protein
MRNGRFWAILILGSLTLLAFIFLLWELIEKNFFKDLDYKTLHFLYITRGIIVSFILATWAIWFIWREKLRHREWIDKIINNSTDAILVYDRYGKIIAFNKAAESLFCSNRKELKSIWDTIPLENKTDFSKKLEYVERGGKLRNYETEKVLEDGAKIPVSLGLVYIDEEGRFVETIRDTRESVMLRNRIIDLEKAQIFGKMAQGIAHHMGTPLASMLLKVQMLKEDISEGTRCSECLEKLTSIERQIFYSQKIIQRLIGFARRPENKRYPESVSSLLEEGTEMIKPLLKKQGIELELYPGEEDLKTLIDKNLLGLVLTDIMMNAIDAMPQGGRLSITASKNLGKWVEITITDTGIGIPRNILPFVFDPFFTTKPAGKGTGLGLSVAKMIIQDHNGEIGIESVEGKGTSVLIRLPIYKGREASA